MMAAARTTARERTGTRAEAAPFLGAGGVVFTMAEELAALKEGATDALSRAETGRDETPVVDVPDTAPVKPALYVSAAPGLGRVTVTVKVEVDGVVAVAGVHVLAVTTAPPAA